VDEAALAAFANDGKYEETVVALAARCKVPINVADRLMAGDRPDAVLLLCKAAGMSWPTAKSVTSVRRDGRGPPNLGFDSGFANYERLSTSTVQRVARFWQVRQNG
jgi:uncharacterized protein (DUF2336 family)